MGKRNLLVTGGGGLLGSELSQLLSDAWFPTSTEFDVTDLTGMQEYCQGKDINTILHAAAFTSPPKCDSSPAQAIRVNIAGTCNVVDLAISLDCHLIYISTDYVFQGDQGNYREDDPVNPVNKYAWSKLGGECAVRLYDKATIVRTTFGPNQFPYPKAFKDQWTSRQSVSQIAAKIAALVDIDFCGTLHVGGPRRTVLEYAKSISPDKHIDELSILDMSFALPVDTSLDCTKFEQIQGARRVA